MGDEKVLRNGSSKLESFQVPWQVIRDVLLEYIFPIAFPDELSRNRPPCESVNEQGYVSVNDVENNTRPVSKLRKYPVTSVLDLSRFRIVSATHAHT